MKRQFKLRYYGVSLGALAASMYVAAPSFAQDVASEVPSEEAVATLGTVTVIAQRRSELLQDVPIAVTAITPIQMQAMGVFTTQDVQLATPGLTFDSGYGFSQPYVRGIGTNQPNPGLESAVASYVDGVYLVRSYGQIGRLFDMSGVEVLRGAQGTLWGRNATGGAILYSTRAPELGEFTAEGTAEFGNQEYALGEVAVNLPLGDTVALRLGYQGSTDDGYVTNIVDGSSWGGGDHSLIRGTLLWEPTSDLSASFMYERLNDTRYTNTFAQRSSSPACAFCIPGGPNPVSGFYEIAYGPTATPTDVESNMAIVRLNYSADKFDFSSTTSWRDDSVVGTINVAAIDYPVQDYATDPSGGQTVAQEFQVVTKFDGIFNGMLGYSYSDDLSYNHNVISGAFVPLPFTAVAVNSDVTTESNSLFAELYIRPNDRLSMTLGARYSIDDRSIFSTLNADAAATFGFGNPNPDGYGNSKSFKEFTPRAVIAYDFGDVNAYASYNRGFKEGGYNTPAFQDVPPVDSEIVDYYETGLKYVSPDNRLNLNAAVFYYEYSDIQVSIVDLSSGTNILQNAAAAEGQGLELEGAYQATDWLNIFGSLSLLETEFTDYPNAAVNFSPTSGPTAGFILGTTTDLTGSELPHAPASQFALGFNIDAPINENWSGHFNALARYTDAYDFFPGAQGLNNYAHQEAYTLVNLSGYFEKRVTGSTPDSFSPDYYRIGFFVNNATDEEYYALRTSQAFIGLLDVAAPPRTYGLRISAGF
jgi:iron complex outermembrane receptor protein